MRHVVSTQPMSTSGPETLAEPVGPSGACTPVQIAAGDGIAGKTGLRQQAQLLMARRARARVSQTRLNVEYYRIRRRVSFPLPIQEPVTPRIPVRGLDAYPWGIWLAWALEERLQCLGWAGHWFDDELVRRTAERDLLALTRWPQYREQSRPDLMLGHAARMLTGALRDWPWLQPTLRKPVENACQRMLSQEESWLRKHYAGITEPSCVFKRNQLKLDLHNIPFIGTMGLALAARCIKHPLAVDLDRWVRALVLAMLEWRKTGFSEGASYDGYLLDFILDWTREAEPAHREQVLSHEQLPRMVEPAIWLGAPGDSMELAPLGDVEPRNMLFHWSAQAKLAHALPDGGLKWHLSHSSLEKLPSAALAALAELPADTRPVPPKAGAVDAHYAMVLRTGWSHDDLAVAVSASHSPMGHIHLDSGSLVLGTAGHWLITDPGYQQYMPTQERQFTLGPKAHNAPCINGMPQKNRGYRPLALESLRPRVWHAALDMTGCYEAELELDRVCRDVWVVGNDLVVVADQIVGGKVQHVNYTWHGDAKGFWWTHEGHALLHVEPRSLCIQSPQVHLSDHQLVRLPGSRGQMSLDVQLPAPTPPCIWWLFSLASAPHPCALLDQGQRCRVGEHLFDVTPGANA